MNRLTPMAHLIRFSLSTDMYSMCEAFPQLQEAIDSFVPVSDAEQALWQLFMIARQGNPSSASVNEKKAAGTMRMILEDVISIYFHLLNPNPTDLDTVKGQLLYDDLFNLTMNPHSDKASVLSSEFMFALDDMLNCFLPFIE